MRKNCHQVPLRDSKATLWLRGNHAKWWGVLWLSREQCFDGFLLHIPLKDRHLGLSKQNTEKYSIRKLSAQVWNVWQGIPQGRMPAKQFQLSKARAIYLLQDTRAPEVSVGSRVVPSGWMDLQPGSSFLERAARTDAVGPWGPTWGYSPGSPGHQDRVTRSPGSPGHELPGPSSVKRCWTQGLIHRDVRDLGVKRTLLHLARGAHGDRGSDMSPVDPGAATTACVGSAEPHS